MTVDFILTSLGFSIRSPFNDFQTGTCRRSDGRDHNDIVMDYLIGVTTIKHWVNLRRIKRGCEGNRSFRKCHITQHENPLTPVPFSCTNTKDLLPRINTTFRTESPTNCNRWLRDSGVKFRWNLEGCETPTRLGSRFKEFKCPLGTPRRF